MVEIINFKNKTKPKSPGKKQKKTDIFKNIYPLFDGKEGVLDVFESKIFQLKTKLQVFLKFVSSKLKIITPKGILQRLPAVFAQVKAGNNSKNLLNET